MTATYNREHEQVARDALHTLTPAMQRLLGPVLDEAFARRREPASHALLTARGRHIRALVGRWHSVLSEFGKAAVSNNDQLELVGVLDDNLDQMINWADDPDWLIARLMDALPTETAVQIAGDFGNVIRKVARRATEARDATEDDMHDWERWALTAGGRDGDR